MSNVGYFIYGAGVGLIVSSTAVYFALNHPMLPTTKDRIASASDAGRRRIRIAMTTLIVVLTIFGGLVGVAAPSALR